MSRCPPLLLLPHVHMSTTSTAINTEVTFSCDPGHIIVGNRRITCTLMGECNGMQPVCMRELTCMKYTDCKPSHRIRTDVVCRELGYPGAISALGRAAFGKGNTTEKVRIFWSGSVELPRFQFMGKLANCACRRRWMVSSYHHWNHCGKRRGKFKLVWEDFNRSTDHYSLPHTTMHV